MVNRATQLEAREAHSQLSGANRLVVPDSFFESREWRGWMSCRRPNEETWDQMRTLQATLQRTMAMAYMVQYQYLAATIVPESGATAARRRGAMKKLAALEAEAQAKMAEIDVRSKK